MKILISLLFLFYLTSAIGADKTIKRPSPKSIRVTVYEAVLRDSVPTAGVIIDNIIFKRFAPNGDKIAEYVIDSEGVVKSKIIFIYNDERQLIQKLHYDEDARLSVTAVCEYGENKQIDRWIFQKHMSQGGTYIEGTFLYTYDDRNRVAGIEKYSSRNELMETCIFKYNDSERMRETVIKNAVSKVIGRLVSKFDERNNVVSEKSYGNSEEQCNSVTCEYQYDAFGSWVSKYESMNGEPDRIVKRDIDYGFDNTDAKRLSLNGKVKSLRQTSYVAVPRGKEILRGAKQGEFVDYLFDKEGRILSETRYSDKGVLQQTIGKTYDEEGKMIADTVSDMKGGKISYAVYFYDVDKRVKSKTVYNGDGIVLNKTLYKYDIEGNLIKESTYDKEGRLYLEFDNLYNVYGQLIQRSAPVRPSDDAIYDKVVRLYNFNGRVEMESVYLPSDSLRCNRSYKYASSGRLVSGTACEPNREVVSYMYKFYNDEQGNWKKRIKFVNDKAMVYEEREYTYYNE